MTQRSGVSSRRLARGYGFTALAFAGLAIMLSLLEPIGLAPGLISYLLGGFALAVLVTIGFAARTTRIEGFYIAERRIPPLFNAMAVAASWLGAAGFVGVAGALYASGNAVLPLVAGGCGGFLLLTVLIAPYLRKSGAYTVPDFLAARFGQVVRIPAVFFLVCCSVPLLLVQIEAATLVGTRLIGMDARAAAVVAIGTILAGSLLGGMRAASWTQAAHYLLLLTGFLLPILLIAGIRYGLFATDSGEWAMGDAAGLRSELAAAGETGLPSDGQPDAFDSAAMIISLALGTAAMPHVLMRFFASRSVHEARLAGAWSVLLVATLLLAAPVCVAILRLAVYSDLAGLPLATLPDWVFALGQESLVSICGVAAITPEAVQAACESLGDTDGVLSLAQLSISPEAVVLAPVLAAGLPHAVAALLSLGAFAAALAAGTGLTVAVANSLSHDIYHRLIDRKAPTGRRLLVGRLALVGVAAAAGWLASNIHAGLLDMAIWCSALSAAVFFPALVLAIWWRGCTPAGALAGMGLGGAVVLWFLVRSAGYGAEWALPDSGELLAPSWAGLLGVLSGAFAAILVSLFAPARSRNTEGFVEDLRRPRGETLLKERPA